MNRSRTVSAQAWLGLTASGLVASAAWFVPHQWPVPAPAVDSELAALMAEHEQLRSNEDAVRDALRRQHEGLRGQAWTDESLAALPPEFGEGWHWEWEAGDRPQRVVLRRTGPGLDDWASYVAVVAALGARPGLIVDAVEARAEGGGRQRRLTVLSLGLRFIRADAPIGDAERATPSRGPLPVAPAAGPATPRKIGPGPSLRRPSASAEPPAAGPDSASFRPDPPGPWAGETTATPTTKPQENPP